MWTAAHLLNDSYTGWLKVVKLILNTRDSWVFSDCVAVHGSRGLRQPMSANHRQTHIKHHVNKDPSAHAFQQSPPPVKKMFPQSCQFQLVTYSW